MLVLATGGIWPGIPPGRACASHRKSLLRSAILEPKRWRLVLFAQPTPNLPPTLRSFACAILWRLPATGDHHTRFRNRICVRCAGNIIGCLFQVCSLGGEKRFIGWQGPGPSEYGRHIARGCPVDCGGAPAVERFSRSPSREVVRVKP